MICFIFQTTTLDLTSMQPWANHFKSLVPSFSFCEMRTDQMSRSLPSTRMPYHSSMLCISVLNVYSSSLPDSWLHTGKLGKLLKYTGA